MIYLVLVEPENEGNYGAIARVMKNFAVKNLYQRKQKEKRFNQKQQKF